MTKKPDTWLKIDMATNTKPPPQIRLGLPNETMGASGAYHSWMPGFMMVSISPDFSFVQYQFAHSYHYKPNVGFTVPCNGIAQAYGIILQLIKQHGEVQFLPDTVTDMDINPNPEL